MRADAVQVTARVVSAVRLLATTRRSVDDTMQGLPALPPPAEVARASRSLRRSDTDCQRTDTTTPTPTASSSTSTLPRPPTPTTVIGLPVISTESADSPTSSLESSSDGPASEAVACCEPSGCARTPAPSETPAEDSPGSPPLPTTTPGCCSRDRLCTCAPPCDPSPCARVLDVLRGAVAAALSQVEAVAPSDVVCTVSGALGGAASAILADCWLGHPPYIASTVVTGLSTVGAVALNTVEWEVVVSTNASVRSQVRLLMLGCFLAMFAHAAYATWHLAEAPRHPSSWSAHAYDDAGCGAGCCASAEGYYVLFLCTSAALFRFGEPAVRDALRRGHRGSPAYAALSSDSVEITVVVAAAALLCTGALLVALASFGRHGSAAALLVPVPQLLLCGPTTVVGARGRVPHAVLWRAWSVVLSVGGYIFSLVWPLLLLHRRYLDSHQTALAAPGNACVLMAAHLVGMVLSAPMPATRGDSGLDFQL